MARLLGAATAVHTGHHIKGPRQLTFPDPGVHSTQFPPLVLREPRLLLLHGPEPLPVLLQHRGHVPGGHLVSHHDTLVSIGHEQPDGILEHILNDLVRRLSLGLGSPSLSL